VEDLVQALGIGDKILLTGPLADGDLAALYSGAKLFLFPSLCEGFGLPPLEAMACGTPVVCSNATSLPEVVGDAALTVDPHDVEALAEAIGRVLSEPKLAAELRTRSLERAQQFTWQRTARETMGVYNQVLGEARGSDDG
jgi:glycosyltransferase involved in cell wall biosynthesis